MLLYEKISAQLPDWRKRILTLLKESGDVKVGDVTISQMYGGMRNVRGLVTDISYVDPVEGIRLRGYTIPELLDVLPKLPGSEMPIVGGLYYLLLVGDLPSIEDALEVEEEWKKRSNVPAYVYDILKAMPGDTHPMTMFSIAVLVMQRESIFAKNYQDLGKDRYWEAMLEDSLNLTAKLPAIAAFIYRLKFKGGHIIQPDLSLDWAGNFAHMMGVSNLEYSELLRLFLIIHSDHESGNVSAHATHLVGSTLSDIFYATSACLDGLAGPLHGLANQECLGWLLDLYNQFNGLPTEDQVRQYAWDTLTSGQVIPGYGHGVLRKTDPRFTAQLEFGNKHLADGDIFNLARMVYKIVPQVLTEQGKASNPWPNVDAISGSLQYYYGVTEFDFYTVLFGVSRLLGVSANIVWARALAQPIERPKSLTTKMLEEIAAGAKPS